MEVLVRQTGGNGRRRKSRENWKDLGSGFLTLDLGRDRLGPSSKEGFLSG